MRGLPDGIRCVLFDAGNTLLFVDYAFISRAAAGLGARVTAREIRQAELPARLEMDRLLREDGGSSDATRWRRYFEVMLTGAGLSPEQFERLAPLLLERHRTVGLWICVRPWTHRALSRLKERGYRLGVVSNADGRVASWLERKGLAGLFDCVVDSHVVGIEKPDPAIFELALRRIGFQARETLYVGDLYAVDVLGARAAGLSAVLLDPLGMHPADDVPRIRRLSELQRLLPDRSAGGAAGKRPPSRSGGPAMQAGPSAAEEAATALEARR